MKLYLFGGAEGTGEVDPLIQLLNQVILDIKPRQLLHVPYARTNVPKGEENYWGEGWAKAKLNLLGVEYLDARSENDLARADMPAIFINGGKDHKFLIDSILANARLHELIMSTEYLIAESAGSMVVGEYQRNVVDGKSSIVKGLGILQSTIIEPHYTQRSRQQPLRDEMKEVGAKYGIGIDTLTAIVTDTDTYPNGYTVMGSGIVEFVIHP